MALATSLEQAFTSGGTFDLGGVLGDLGADVLDVDLGELSFDPTDLLNVVSELGPPDLASLADLAAGVAGSIDVGGAVVGDLDALLAPLHGLLALGEGLAGDPLAIASPTGTGVGPEAVGANVGSALDLLRAGPLRPFADLLGDALPGVDLTATIDGVGSSLAGVIALLRLVGGLMAVESVSARAARQSALVASMLNPGLAARTAADLHASCGGDLEARIGTVDPDDQPAVDDVLAGIGRFCVAVRGVGDEWSRGLGFGEAALVGLDASAVRAQLDLSRAALDERQLPAVATAAADLRARVDSVLAIELPDPSASLDATYEAVAQLIDPLRTVIEGLDVETIGGHLTSGLSAAVAPLEDVTGTLESVGIAIGAAIRQLRDVVVEIDLAPVTEAVTRALAPITAALDAIEQAIGDATGAIEDVAGTITDGLTDITDAVAAVATTVEGAFGALARRLEAVDFAAVQDAIVGGLGPVADQLASAQLTPYFSATDDAIDTATSVIDKVPFGLLPTDLQQEVVDICQPIKAIDFDAIADGLRDELRAILDALDTDVLDAVDAAYQEVLGFLSSIDPRAAIAEFEAGPFAELKATLDAIDPGAVLAPVEEAIAPVRTLLDGVDLRASVLDPIAGVFDTVLAELGRLDPVALLAPVTAEVDALREQVRDGLQLTTWATAVSDGRDHIVGVLEAADPTRLAESMSGGAVDRLRAEPASGPGLVGQVVGLLSQAAGLPAEAESWTTVRTWFSSGTGQSEVEARLGAAAAALDGTLAQVEALDPGALVVSAQACHRRLLQAMQAHPADSRLRTVGEAMLTDNAPGTVVAPLVENHARYAARLRADAATMRALPALGLSQVQVVADGLIDALIPLTSLAMWLRSLLERFGMPDVSRPLPELLYALVDGLGPARVVPLAADLTAALRAKLVALVDATVAPLTDGVAAIETAVDRLDLAPVVSELAALHGDVVDLVASLDPAVLLGPTLDDADQVIDRVAGFDPLGAVRAVVDALRAAIDEVFAVTTPSVVFAPVADIYATLLGLAGGLDVRGLLQPVLDALASLAGQLETGIEGTADALGRLQAALPDEVDDAAASVSGSVSGGLWL